MASVFDYIFNIGGNFTAQINGMSAAAGEFSAQADIAESRSRKLSSTLASLTYVKDVAQNLADGVSALTASGIRLDSQMHDLSAVAGVTGEGLKQIETFARESAQAFGTDASVAVEGYKLLLSQLSPELGKYPEALSAMGDCIQTTSKLMGGDGVAAAQVLTTAMNQYGVSLEDPTAASEEMARMMDVMAAAGQAGSAELPAISAALQQCGMAAKAANVSFEETNAAIQVLDKAGKKASEGGVALRNVLGQLGKGRFIEKQAAEEMAKAGIDVNALADNSKSLKERLEMLKPLLNDDALLSKFFGVENKNAARALIQGTDALEGFTTAVTGTNSATEQAAIKMDSYAERQARINQKFEDFKISLFQITGDFSIWCGSLTSALVPLAQLSPILTALWSTMTAIKALNWANTWNWIKGAIYASRIQMLLMNRELLTGQFVSNGFLISMARATLAVIRFATVGLWNAIKGMAVFILDMLTGGGTIAAFSTISSTAFATFSATATTAFRAVSVAFYSIPFFGWVAIIISVCAAAIAYFWNTSAKFRAVLKGIWAAFKTTFMNIRDLARQIFGGIGDLLKACFNLDAAGISDALNKLKSGFTDYGKEIGRAFNVAYDAEMSEAAKKDAAEKKKGKTTGTATPTVATPPITPLNDPTAGTLSTAGGCAGGSSGDSGGKIKNITISIEKLIENFTIHTATTGESMDQMKAAVLDTLMGALNDTQLAID